MIHSHRQRNRKRDEETHIRDQVKIQGFNCNQVSNTHNKNKLLRLMKMMRKKLRKDFEKKTNKQSQTATAGIPWQTNTHSHSLIY